MSKSIIHMLDSARGVYIPRDFAQIIKRDCVKGVRPDVLDFLAKDQSPEHDFYWDYWHDVLDNARIISGGIEYTLHHDGDLWLVNYDMMTEQEKIGFFGEY